MSQARRRTLLRRLTRVRMILDRAWITANARLERRALAVAVRIEAAML